MRGCLHMSVVCRRQPLPCRRARVLRVNRRPCLGLAVQGHALGLRECYPHTHPECFVDTAFGVTHADSPRAVSCLRLLDSKVHTHTHTPRTTARNLYSLGRIAVGRLPAVDVALWTSTRQVLPALGTIHAHHFGRLVGIRARPECSLAALVTLAAHVGAILLHTRTARSVHRLGTTTHLDAAATIVFKTLPLLARMHRTAVQSGGAKKAMWTPLGFLVLLHCAWWTRGRGRRRAGHQTNDPRGGGRRHNNRSGPRRRGSQPSIPRERRDTGVELGRCRLPGT